MEFGGLISAVDSYSPEIINVKFFWLAMNCWKNFQIKWSIIDEQNKERRLYTNFS